MNHDPAGPQFVGELNFSPTELTVIWATLYLNANAMNAGIRGKIERFLAENGVPTAELEEVAAHAARFAEQFAQSTPAPPADQPPAA